MKSVNQIVSTELHPSVPKLTATRTTSEEYTEQDDSGCHTPLLPLHFKHKGESALDNKEANP